MLKWDNFLTGGRLCPLLQDFKCELILIFTFIIISKPYFHSTHFKLFYPLMERLHLLHSYIKTSLLSVLGKPFKLGSILVIGSGLQTYYKILFKKLILIVLMVKL